MSVNPCSDTVVMEAPVVVNDVARAARSAWAEQRGWFETSLDDRMQALLKVADILDSRSEPIAQAVTQEMGKLFSEALGEVGSLAKRIRAFAGSPLDALRPKRLSSLQAEQRFHPLGVVGIIGPFNYPLHLLHAHVVPALVAGNTVVLKPSERTPLSAQLYVEAFEEAGLSSVINMVQGGGEVGAALVAACEVTGLVFTGSWHVGHLIRQAAVSRPELLVALEMGGQNMALVLDDADPETTVEELILGGFLTTGQRCTCTSRVLVAPGIADDLIDLLRQRTSQLTWGDPTSDVFMGPLASRADKDRVDALCAAAIESGAEALLKADEGAHGAFRGPSLHLIKADHRSPYTEAELFGPDLAITRVKDVNDAIELVNQSPYGLSMSVFTEDQRAFEAIYRRTKVGCVNLNRSTNRATGLMPFGGVGRSGNFRPAGSDAYRNVTFPVQIQWTGDGPETH